MKHLNQILGSVRPNFMLLSPLCVLLGIAAAAQQGPIDPLAATLALVGGALAHAAVNLLNEYDDFRSGLDAITVRTPFSGGSGTLPAHPDAARATLVAGVICIVGTLLIGVYFATTVGLAVIPLGLAGLLIVIGYTPWITRHPLLCLFAPGVGFGPLMTGGTSLVLTGHYSWTSFWVAAVPLCLVSTLLLINQFPDVEADRRIGRHHLPIAIGRRASARIYGVLLLSAFAIVAGLTAMSAMSGWLALALLPLPAALFLAIRVVRDCDDLARLLPLLGLNVAVTLGTILLLAAGLLLGVPAGS